MLTALELAGTVLIYAAVAAVVVGTAAVASVIISVVTVELGSRDLDTIDEPVPYLPVDGAGCDK